MIEWQKIIEYKNYL